MGHLMWAEKHPWSCQCEHCQLLPKTLWRAFPVSAAHRVCASQDQRPKCAAGGDPFWGSAAVLLEMTDMKEVITVEDLLHRTTIQQINLSKDSVVLAACALHCCTPRLGSWLKLIGENSVST